MASGRLSWSGRSLLPHARDSKVYLEDLDLSVDSDGVRAAAAGAWARWIGAHVSPEDPELFARRFVVVGDEVMTFFWETGTQVDTRVRIDAETRTVARGALWSEESLPPETVLMGVASADKSRREKKSLTPRQVLDTVLERERTLQFGGKATVGRGLCRLVPTRTEEARRSYRTREAPGWLPRRVPTLDRCARGR